MVLLFVLSCDPSKSTTRVSEVPDAVDVDADLDGATAAEDCDDSEAGIHPGAAEVCDGVDQDCDGSVDDGVPSDGAGCADPGWPEFPDVVDTIHLTLRTGDGTFDGTDDGGVTVCLSETTCLSPYKENWDDLDPGQLDVIAHEGLGVARSELTGVTIATTEGDDLWRPVAAQLSFDGELVYCRELTLDIGAEDDETASWADPEGLGLGCTTVFDTTLTHGPIVGAVGPDRARIWYRTDTTRHVQLLIGDAVVDHGYPAADRDFTEVVEVVGLTPATSYTYALDVDGERHGPWSFTTAPSEGAPSAMRLAFGSCSKEDDQPVFGAIAAWEPDLFLFIGDNHYANTAELGGLRQYYRWAHEREDRAALQAATSTLATWDDHDFTGNNTDGTAPGRDTALRVFGEYWANAGYGSDEAPGVYTRQAWGDVELFLVDDRYHRGLDGTLLGAEQESWLFGALAESGATFKLVASGSQFTPYGSDDSWASFPDAWDAFREAIVTLGIEGVVLLSGDIHRFEVRELSPANGGYTLPEITSSPLAQLVPAGCGDDDDEPDRVLCLDESSGFVGLEIDTTATDPTLTAVIFDADGAETGRWTTTRSALELP